VIVRLDTKADNAKNRSIFVKHTNHAQTALHASINLVILVMVNSINVNVKAVGVVLIARKTLTNVPKCVNNNNHARAKVNA
jgi:hypothetical protein